MIISTYVLLLVEVRSHPRVTQVAVKCYVCCGVRCCFVFRFGLIPVRFCQECWVLLCSAFKACPGRLVSCFHKFLKWGRYCKGSVPIYCLVLLIWCLVRSTIHLLHSCRFSRGSSFCFCDRSLLLFVYIWVIYRWIFLLLSQGLQPGPNLYGVCAYSLLYTLCYLVCRVWLVRRSVGAFFDGFSVVFFYRRVLLILIYVIRVYLLFHVYFIRSTCVPAFELNAYFCGRIYCCRTSALIGLEFMWGLCGIWYLVRSTSHYRLLSSVVVICFFLRFACDVLRSLYSVFCFQLTVFLDAVLAPWYCV